MTGTRRSPPGQGRDFGDFFLAKHSEDPEDNPTQPDMQLPAIDWQRFPILAAHWPNCPPDWQQVFSALVEGGAP